MNLKLMKLRLLLAIIFIGRSLIGIYSYCKGDCVTVPLGSTICGESAWKYVVAYVVWLVIGVYLFVTSFRLKGKRKFGNKAAAE